MLQTIILILAAYLIVRLIQIPIEKQVGYMRRWVIAILSAIGIIIIAVLLHDQFLSEPTVDEIIRELDRLKQMR